VEHFSGLITRNSLSLITELPSWEVLISALGMQGHESRVIGDM
jgi:hypothetical protein